VTGPEQRGDSVIVPDVEFNPVFKKEFQQVDSIPHGSLQERARPRLRLSLRVCPSRQKEFCRCQMPANDRSHQRRLAESGCAVHISAEIQEQFSRFPVTSCCRPDQRGTLLRIVGIHGLPLLQESSYIVDRALLHSIKERILPFKAISRRQENHDHE
jgi:hypothetical protein